MNVLLTGATGYIGKRLLPVLVNRGHQVVCCVRDKNRFNPAAALRAHIRVIEVDFLDRASLKRIPRDLDGACYLMHSMSCARQYEELEKTCAHNFRTVLSDIGMQHVVYLSGIVNQQSLSRHLSSRKAVEEELAKGRYSFTALRSGIIIGSGSASFEIIRDLVEKLPVMIAPKWIKTRSQPIAVRDVIHFLEKTLFNAATYDRCFDIGGPDILSYKEMMLGYAKVRGLKRRIFVVPIVTPKLSSYWLYFVTATSYKLATALVSSMRVEVICRNDDLNALVALKPISYKEALQRSLSKIQSHQIASSWKDALVSGTLERSLSDFIQVPSHGCFTDERDKPIIDREQCVERIWRIGGQTGWYYADWLWKIRGFLDKLFGGVGLRGGRMHPSQIAVGDAVDFWRVLHADRAKGHLLLFAEMKLPGEAWLEFKILDDRLRQTATFRPKGILGRLYWYSVYPLHVFLFNGLLQKLTQ